MNLLFPLGMAALGALVPLVVLYLLKRKRVETVVPTNFLWALALEDLRASSLFQRLRTPLLLFLQALAITLFGLAAAGASLDLDVGGAPRRIVLLVDRSRSMTATDGEDGRTRFEEAVELARDVVDGLSGADELMLVAFAERAEVLTTFTADSSRLEQALDDLRPYDASSRAADAFRLAVSFADASAGFRLEAVVISDGALADEVPDVPFPVKYARVGSSDANQGIAAVHVARAIGEEGQLFVRVDNGAARAASRSVSLERDGKVVDAQALAIGPGASGTVFFELPEPAGDAAEIITVRLGGEADVVAADDRVDLVLRPVVPRTGLLVSDSTSLYMDAKKVEELHPGLALTRVSSEEAVAVLASDTPVDLVCYDRVTPTELPPVAAQLYIDALPPDSGLASTGTQEYPIIIDWDRTHGTTTRCSFDDVVVLEAMQLSGVERSHTLVESTGGPLVLLTPVPGREVVVVAFSPEKSNLPLKLAWPLFLANTLDFLLADVQRPGEEELAPTGTPIEVRDEGKLRVETPGGSTEEVELDGEDRARFSDTHEAGVYLVTTDARDAEPRAFALLDPAEVRVAPVEELQIGGEAVVSDPGSLRQNLLLRDPLLVLALGLLVLEWAVWCGRR